MGVLRVERIPNIFSFFLVAMLLSACNKEAAQPETGKKAWVTDEVLVQLQEIKSDLVEVKKHQAEIKALLEKGRFVVVCLRLGPGCLKIRVIRKSQ